MNNFYNYITETFSQSNEQDEYTYRLLDSSEINIFLSGLNRAFCARQSDTIPYLPETADTLRKEWKDGAFFVGCYIGESLCGGLQVQINANRIARIRHVWVEPKNQGHQIARKMVLKVENVFRGAGVCIFSLSVAHNYQPAVKLYKKCGYRIVGIYANMPHTYHFWEMEHRDNKNIATECRRIISLGISIIKYSLLFSKDSTPTLLHRIIFTNRKNDSVD